LIAFSDYRVQDIELFIEELSKLQPRADLILYGGDDIERFHLPNGRNLFEEIAAQARYGLCAVIGNDDEPSVRKLISGKSVLNVHLRPAKLGSYAILGIEGAPRRPDLIGMGLSHSEQEIAKQLNFQRRTVGAAQLIIVSHAPPEGILDRAVRHSPDGKPRSIGSRALRKFIKDRKEALLVVCGHVHRCGGLHEKTYGTLVVNAANHDYGKAITRYAVLELDSTGLKKIEWRLIRPVSIVPGIGDVSAERLRGVGIRTVEELAAAPAETVCQTALYGRLPEILQARARAIVANRPVFLRRPESTGEHDVFLDIETDLEPNLDKKYIWLIGLCVGGRGKYHSFFADIPKEEKTILRDFLNFMEGHPKVRILTCSGSRFEERVIRRRLTIHGLPLFVCDRMIDLHQEIPQTVALPTSSYQVKEIGSFFGYQYKHPELDGTAVASLYMHTYQKSKHRLRRKKLGQKLIEYNEDDVRCLPFILKAIEMVWNKENSEKGAQNS